MLTSRELLDLIQAKLGTNVPYSRLLTAMAKCGAKFKTKRVHGHDITAYLTVADIVSVCNVLRINPVAIGVYSFNVLVFESNAHLAS